MLPLIILLVISVPDTLSSKSILSHSLVYTSSPFLHLHPGYTGAMKECPSSIYITYLLILILTSSIFFVQALSQEHMIRLAIAHVALRLVAPPDFCLKVFQPKM